MLRVYFDDELIDVEAYTELDNEYKLFTDTFKLGSVASNTFKLSVLKTAVNSQPTNVRIEDDVTVMNFIVYNVTEDDYVYDYTLTDKLLNFNFNYDASELINSKAELEEDCYLSDIWHDMCDKANVEYDDTYVFENDIVVTWYDSRVQARKYLSYIAELQSGYACMLENGKQSFKKQNRSSVKTIDADECSDLIVGQRTAAEYGAVPANAKIDDDKFYALPEWTSGDGYALLESFTNTLYSPLARAELKQVLVSGRGVFKNFKNVLKAYPEVERKWHFYKDSKMRARLMDWYNELRESWGLEKLEQTDVEEVGDLVQNDVMFREYDSAKDRNDIALGVSFVADEYKRQFAGEVGDAVAELWRRASTYDEAAKYGFVCRTQSDEFAGCILVSNCPSSAKKTVTLTDFFVVQNCRGLGIGKELLSKCLAGLRRRGFQWFLIANTIIPQTMEPLLTQSGFEKLGSGFVADLCRVDN